jgi:hypothetical protein
MDLVPESLQKKFGQELYGVIGEDKSTYLSITDLETHFSKTNIKRFADMEDGLTVYIAVDPPACGKSKAGIVAVTFSRTGTVYLVGVSELQIPESSMPELKSLISRFTASVVTRMAPYSKKQVHVIPIVE